MADEPILTTIRVDQLPPQAITLSSAIPHALGTTLYKGLISEIIALLPQSVSYRPYEVKQLNVTDLYITQNFTLDGTASSGIGKSDGLWAGWAIMNGNNGTTNMDGAIALGYWLRRYGVSFIPKLSRIYHSTSIIDQRSVGLNIYR